MDSIIGTVTGDIWDGNDGDNGEECVVVSRLVFGSKLGARSDASTCPVETSFEEFSGAMLGVATDTSVK